MKTILITGASSGFGEACAKRFAVAGGCRLILAARRVDRLEALKKRVDCPVHVVELDVRDHNAVLTFVSALPEEFATVDVLVNNAGLALGTGPANLADVNDWERMIDTNVKGLIYLTRHILPGMVERNRGHIVNIGSIAASWPYPGGNVYCATKAFVQQFSRTLRADLAGKHIRVTNIEPGLAETEFSTVRFKGDTEEAGKVYDQTQPLTGADIAEIVQWVTSVPPHVNINVVEVMPVCQSWGPLAISRGIETRD